MSDYRDRIDAIGDASEVMTDSVEKTSDAAKSLSDAFKGMRDEFTKTGKTTEALGSSLSGDLKTAFKGLAFEGMTLSDALKKVANTIIETTFDAAITPVTDKLGGSLAKGVGSLITNILPFEDGAPFSQGRVVPFATGGVVSSPTMFPMRGATGLMGEAGPEAIMPLARGPDGKLGVRGAGGGGSTIVMNISTPDAQSFQRSRGQIAAQMSRALSRGERNH